MTSTVDLLKRDNALEIIENLDNSSKRDLLDEISSLSDSEVVEVEAAHATIAPFASYYTDIAWTFLESAACVLHVDLVSCNRAANNASTASATAARVFPNSLHNGKGDAFRHCYWNALMVHSIGLNGATKIASNHEYVKSAPANERAMDLANNKSGRWVGTVQSQSASAATKCKSLTNDGRLVTL